jgi:cytochrome c-type biogenesis protein CcmH
VKSIFSTRKAVRPELVEGLPFLFAKELHCKSSPSTSSGRTVWGLGLALILMTSAPTFADSSMPAAPLANVQLDDAGLEAKAHDLMLTIRCVVCQGQSVADSDAEMAGDMRSFIRTRIAAGEEPEKVRTWLVERYGEWISYDPPLSGRTAILWLLPLLLLGSGTWLARGRFRRRAA